MSKTIGESIVRTEFNPSDSSTVAVIKSKFAELINYIQDNIEDMYTQEVTTNQVKGYREYPIPDLGRLKAITRTKLEEACMFAVKAATTTPPTI